MGLLVRLCAIIMWCGGEAMSGICSCTHGARPSWLCLQVPCEVAWGRVVPAMRNRRATGRAAADSNALFGSEAAKPANTSEAIAVSLPVIGMPTVSLCPLPYCCAVKSFA